MPAYVVAYSTDAPREKAVRILNTFPSLPLYNLYTLISYTGTEQELNSMMSLLSREQVVKSWYAKNPAIGFLDLLYALEQHKSISTEYGLNVIY